MSSSRSVTYSIMISGSGNDSSILSKKRRFSRRTSFSWRVLAWMIPIMRCTSSKLVWYSSKQRRQTMRDGRLIKVCRMTHALWWFFLHWLHLRRKPFSCFEHPWHSICFILNVSLKIKICCVGYEFSFVMIQLLELSDSSPWRTRKQLQIFVQFVFHQTSTSVARCNGWDVGDAYYECDLCFANFRWFPPCLCNRYSVHIEIFSWSQFWFWNVAVVIAIIVILSHSHFWCCLKRDLCRAIRNLLVVDFIF